MICPNCRSVAAEGSTRCQVCGFLLTGETQAAAISDAPEPWSPYPGMNTPTVPPPNAAGAPPSQQAYSYQHFTPYPEHPSLPLDTGATWPGETPAHFRPDIAYAPGGGGSRRSFWQMIAPVIAISIVIAGLMFVWFNAHQRSAPNAIATQSPALVVNSPTLAPVPSACRQLSDFIGANTATITPMFPEDVPFPTASLSYLGDSFTDGSYAYDLVDVCSNGISGDGVRAFFSQTLPQSGWTQSNQFPYQGNPTRACGDPYCWQNSSSPSRFISLEQVQNVRAGATTYMLRLAVYTG